MRPSSEDVVARWAARRIAEGRMPAAAWWIEADGAAPVRGFDGAAALEPEPESLTAETAFDLASLTKPLATAPLLLMLADDGRLDLRAPVVEALPELRGTPWSAVSAEELARHGAGLPAWRPLCAQAADLPGYVEQIGRLVPAVPRGTTLYSDLGYMLLGAIIERVGGESLDRAFRRRIAAPAGVAEQLGFAPASWAPAAATESGNRYERAMAGADGAGYAWRERPIRGSVHDANAHALGGVAGHAGLFGTLDATVRLARELYSGSRIRLSPTARRQWSRVDPIGRRSVGMQAADANGATRGLLPADAPGHTGFTGTSLWFEPAGSARGGLCVLLTNRIHPRVDERSFQPVRRAFHRLASRGLGIARDGADR